MVNKLLLGFCDQNYLETKKAKLHYCHPVKKLGSLLDLNNIKRYWLCLE